MLERSTLAADPAEQIALLKEAEERLLKAQAINPLNTDHTANLARLYTRWAPITSDEAERARLLETAEQYYRQALNLSPQNSVIRNEYARLLLELKRDCEGAINLYNETITIDPFYEATYFALADAYAACAARESDTGTQTAYWEAAVASLEEGLRRDPQNVTAWMQLGQINQQLGAYQEAFEAYETARSKNRGQIPPWLIDFREATTFLDLGNEDLARQLAEQALASAPPDAAPQIELFLNQLSSGDE